MLYSLSCENFKSSNLDWAFRKSYAVTTWTPITTYKLVEYITNIHLMLFKKIHVVIKVHFTVFKHDIFLCVKFVFCAFCSDLKKENIRYKEDLKSEEV